LATLNCYEENQPHTTLSAFERINQGFIRTLQLHRMLWIPKF
jgi:hypothetical protein